MKSFYQKILFVVGVLLVPLIWFFLNRVLEVSERYLPSPESVFFALYNIEPNILIQTWATVSRLYIGFVLGSLVGILAGIYLFTSETFRLLILPTLHALRALPPVAAIPFLLLWFGFSDIGKYIVIVIGCGANLAFAAYQILLDMPQKYQLALQICRIDRQRIPWKITAPLVCERILPTMRFSLTTAIGLIIVAELLGSQVGLGYIIQSARSTFTLQTIFLGAIVLSIIAAVSDFLLVIAWNHLIFWSKHESK